MIEASEARKRAILKNSTDYINAYSRVMDLIEPRIEEVSAAGRFSVIVDVYHIFTLDTNLRNKVIGDILIFLRERGYEVSTKAFPGGHGGTASYDLTISWAE